MRTMTARYPGKCTRTGAPIRPGDLIVYAGKGSAYLLDLLTDVDPELANSDPDAAAHAGRYLRRGLEQGVSHVWKSGGKEFYRNRRGLCEDAPCCGCCNT